MGKWILFLIIVMATIIPVTHAQQGNSQFCVRAYEDDNGNMMRDPGEPLLQSGIIVSLHDMRGVVIGTATLENSPTREQGLVCFNNLPDGQYAIFVDSVQYRATTTENMIAQLSTTSQLAVLEYGGQNLQRNQTTSIAQNTAPTTFTPNWERVGVAAIWGSATAMIVGTIGLLLYVLFIRPYNRRVMRQRPLTPYNTPPVPNDYYQYQSPTTRRNYFEYEDTNT
ncbi:MAG: hypothetical protein CUN52_06085 [Phototrophicales bacterium]|nr:MAG: hypothetical protein CUN52_06085 [Phototrophicales bacterium]